MLVEEAVMKEINQVPLYQHIKESSVINNDRDRNERLLNTPNTDDVVETFLSVAAFF